MTSGARAVRPVTVALAAVLLAVQAIGIVAAWQQVGRPFPGFLVSHRLVVEQLEQPYWSGIRAGLRPGDLVRSIDGVSLTTAGDLFDVLEREGAGSTHRYAVERNGVPFEVDVESATFGMPDFVVTFGILALTVVVFVLVGTAVAWVRRDALGVGVFAFSFVVGLAMAGSVPLTYVPALSPLSRLPFAVLVAGLLHFALAFPEPIRFRGRAWVVGVIPYVACLPLAILNVLVARPEVAVVEWANRWLTLGAALVILGRIALFYVQARREPGSSGGLAEERVGVTLAGTIFAIIAFAAGFVSTELGWIPAAPTSVYLLPAWIWFGTVGLASVRDDAFDLGALRHRTIVPTIIYGFGGFAYLLLAAVVLHSVEQSRSRIEPSILALGFVLLAVLVYGSTRRVGRRVSGGGSGPSLLGSRILRDLTVELSASLDEAEIEARVRALGPRLGFERVRLFRYREGTWAEVGVETPLTSSHPAISVAEAGQEVIEGPALESLDLACAVPLRHGGRLLGLFGLGPRQRSRLSREDLEVLTTLASQMAVALDNARAFRRIRELEIELRAENVILKEALQGPASIEGLIGRSEAMKELHAWIEQVAGLDTTVLLRGETGTGKELVARALHARGRRRERSLIRINCAAVPPRLLEAELFGWERGAFTGATARRIGRFELAHGGTLFLDEIAELPPELQPKLLRFLQEREFQRVGGSTTLVVDVRVIAATNRDLEAAVREGRFREDLYFRLDVVSMTVPPLRDRREDIPALVAHLIERHGKRLQKRIQAVDERSLRAVLAYDWPGNVRELENVIERAMVLSKGPTLTIPDVFRPVGAASRVSGAGAIGMRPLAETLREVKMRSIRRALEKSGGNQAAAAALLGLKPSSLSRMIRSLGFRQPDERMRRMSSVVENPST